jgi:hypothetical protein
VVTSIGVECKYKEVYDLLVNLGKKNGMSEPCRWSKNNRWLYYHPETKDLENGTGGAARYGGSVRVVTMEYMIYSLILPPIVVGDQRVEFLKNGDVKVGRTHAHARSVWRKG